MTTTTTGEAPRPAPRNPFDAPGVRIERVRADAPDRLEAALTGAGPHVEAVLDVGTAESGDLLLVLPEPAARLSDLLRVPGWPTAGEAVTVLIPLAEALDELHTAGVALGDAGPDSVVLDADGSPAWRIPPHPVLRRRAGAERFDTAVQEDRRRFVAFATALTAKAGRPLDVTAEATSEALVDALFALAEPVPLRLRPIAAPEQSGPPSRLVEPVRHEDRGASAGPIEGVLRRTGALLAPLRTVRRRVWAAAGVAAGGLLLAVVLLPAGPADGEVAVLRTPSAAPVGSAATAADRPANVPVASKDLDGEAAVAALLRARHVCLDAGDERCLGAVDAAGSPAEVADRAAITSGTEAAGIGAVEGGDIAVLSDGGGTVVADVGGVVVVAVRQQDGWRLRDVIAPPPS